MSRPTFSLIIPAFNEADCLPATLAQAKVALAAVEIPGELIVVDNNSTDATPTIAREAGATVVFEAHNQIARARNVGARAARGDFLIFLDADTFLPAELLREALQRLSTHLVAGGGATIRFDRLQGWIGESCLSVWTWISRWMGWAAGSFVYVRREAFDAIGGFSERVYAGEEVFFSRQLGRWARRQGQRVEIIPAPPVVTSARKFDWHPAWKVALTHLLLGLFPPLVRSRRFCAFWYRRPGNS